VPNFPDIKDAALVAVGFTRCADGTLTAPAGTRISLAPVQGFYRLALALPTGDVVSCVVAGVALKISRQELKP
jgi:hypothetical protein